MSSPLVSGAADAANIRAGLVDGLSIAAALAAQAPRVRMRHVEQAFAFAQAPSAFRVDALHRMIGHFAGRHAPLPWTRVARERRDAALNPLDQIGRAFPKVALHHVAGLLETAPDAFAWASPERFGLGALLNRSPGPADNARMLMLAMLGVTSLETDPVATKRHAMRIANLLSVHSAHGYGLLEQQLHVSLERTVALESREQSFAYFLQAGRDRQAHVTAAPLTRDAWQILCVLLDAVSAGTLGLPLARSNCADLVATAPTAALVSDDAPEDGHTHVVLPVLEVTATPAFEGLLVGWEGRSVASAGARRAMTPILHRGDGHLITIAPTGAGKGVGAVIPALLSHGGSAVVIDPKGENYAVTAGFRRALGQHVFVLDPFEITGATSDRLNPLDLFGERDAISREDALLLTELLAMESATVARNRYWYDRGRELLATALLVAAHSESQREQGLAGMMALFSDSLGTLRKLGRMLMMSKNQDLSDAAGILLVGHDETLQSYRMVAQSMVAALDDSAVLAVCRGPSTLSLDLLTQDVPLTIYLVLPPDKLVSHASLLRLWVGMLLTAVQRRTLIPARPTLFLLDEAAQLGALPQLVTAITLMRGYGLQVWSFWQDLAQLRHLYPLEWPTLLHNCAVHQVFGVPHEAAAQQLAQLNGLDDHRTLLDKDGRSLLLGRAGRLPDVVRRPNYLSDAPFADLAAANPIYANYSSTTSSVTQLCTHRVSPPTVRRAGGAL